MKQSKRRNALKALLGLVLCLAMGFSAIPAMALEYTLPEKLVKQLTYGSGLKGTVTLQAAGTDPWVQPMATMSDLTVEVRGIATDGDYQYRFYVPDGETQKAVTTVFGNGEAAHLASELLPGLVLEMPIQGDVMNTLLGTTGEQNPVWYAAAVNLLNVPDAVWEAEWLPLLARYETEMELWLKDFASAPSVVREDKGETTMLVSYEVPAEAVKKQMATLLGMVLQDTQLLTLLSTQVSEPQMGAYLQPTLLPYYEELIAGIPLTGAITLQRRMTTRGEPVSTSIALPLPENKDGWQTLRLEQVGNQTIALLEGVGLKLEVVFDETTTTADTMNWTGIITYLPADKEQKAVSATFSLNRIHSTSVDNDTREHDVNTYELALNPDTTRMEANGLTAMDCMDFTPMTARVKVHYHSKNAPTSPTTLEITADFAMGSSSVSVDASFKTASPWVMEPNPTGEVVNIL